MSDGGGDQSKPAAKISPGGRGLDEIDRKILDILQRDSDRAVSAIAEEVNLSSTPCWRRIKRLEESGIIKRRVAIVDRRLMNVSMTIFIGIKAPRHEMSWLNAFRSLIEEIPEVVEAYRLTGATDYVIKVVVPDIETYDAVYKKMISKLEFSEINSSISMEEMKFTTAVPTSYS
ncbi:Lrp/AsnC family transcriptional regulator [Mesorhizobium sp. J18]|uniref:Lrp/AsnC family transcriptional regulator n=1 Tax=Mesorhizobium sp. J18 TaxID=935263 RepID=UPI00119934BE|nr:Lrp/AsnC family transcriptional regulator [Mesorhizobium sp. J18]TWG92478.1 Lrp/AsnC family transcriptional regulator [Mesorhizobium sp. J18]